MTVTERMPAGAQVSLCTHPDCMCDNGKAARTPDGMCPSCQRRVATVLERVALDWVALRRELPAPRSGEKTRTAKVTEYGHPAQWASDTAARIAGCLRAAHDNLAEALSGRRPGESVSSELAAVRDAYNYLSVRIEMLCRQDWAPDIITEWLGLHAKVRSQLGLTRPRVALPTPCPQCELRTLTRFTDVQRDWVQCGNCHTQIPSQHYGLYTQMVLDELVSR